jgi:acyl-CoA thioester hydrolase
MPDPWPDLAGRLVPGGHVLPVRVYFEDTDFTGFVYHGSYIRFMERGRSDFIRCLGVNHRELDAGIHGEPLAFAVRHMAVDFLKPARIDDLLEVHTRPLPGKGVRLLVSQSIRRCGARRGDAHCRRGERDRSSTPPARCASGTTRRRRTVRRRAFGITFR